MPAFPPAPPSPPDDGTAFTQSLWQRWFSGLSGAITSAISAAVTAAVNSSAATLMPLAGGTFTGQVRFPEGSALTPGIAFVGDGGFDTGIFHTADGVFAFTNNTQQTWTFSPGSTSSSVSLSVSGAITGTTVGQTSDERLKRSWRKLPQGLVEGMAGLRERNRAGLFTWKEGGQRAVGLGAQSVEAILPLAVVKAADGTRSVQYGVLAALASVEIAERLLKAEADVKDLRERLEQMEWREGRR